MTISIICLALVLRCFTNDSMFWILIWPGTAAHEFCHWLLGKCLFAEPVDFSLLPKERGSTRVLGSVSFKNINWLNAFPTGMAPLLCIPAVFWLSTYLQFGYNWASGLIVWALASALSQCLPSSTDWSIAMSYPVGLLFWGATGLVILHFWVG
jgi:hypothetical protein